MQNVKRVLIVFGVIITIQMVMLINLYIRPTTVIQVSENSNLNRFDQQNESEPRKREKIELVLTDVEATADLDRDGFITIKEKLKYIRLNNLETFPLGKLIKPVSVVKLFEDSRSRNEKLVSFFDLDKNGFLDSNEFNLISDYYFYRVKVCTEKGKLLDLNGDGYLDNNTELLLFLQPALERPVNMVEKLTLDLLRSGRKVQVYTEFGEFMDINEDGYADVEELYFRMRTTLYGEEGIMDPNLVAMDPRSVIPVSEDLKQIVAKRAAEKTIFLYGSGKLKVCTEIGKFFDVNGDGYIDSNEIDSRVYRDEEEFFFNRIRRKAELFGHETLEHFLSYKDKIKVFTETGKNFDIDKDGFLNSIELYLALQDIINLSGPWSILSTHSVDLLNKAVFRYFD